MNLLQLFNDKFLEMLKDLSKVFPNDPDFKLYITSLRMVLMANESLVRNVFHEKVVVPFEAQILSRNEAFFLDKDYSEYSDAAHAGGIDPNKIVSKLKNCWASLNEENRDVIWKYLNVLVLLDKKIQQ